MEVALHCLARCVRFVGQSAREVLHDAPAQAPRGGLLQDLPLRLPGGVGRRERARRFQKLSKCETLRRTTPTGTASSVGARPSRLERVWKIFPGGSGARMLLGKLFARVYVGKLPCTKVTDVAGVTEASVWAVRLCAESRGLVVSRVLKVC